MTRSEAKDRIEKTCGRGWLPLVDRAYDALPSQLTIIQAYQKWGALRFDVDVEDEAFAAVLEAIETESLESRAGTTAVCSNRAGRPVCIG